MPPDAWRLATATRTVSGRSPKALSKPPGRGEAGLRGAGALRRRAQHRGGKRGHQPLRARGRRSGLAGRLGRGEPQARANGRGPGGGCAAAPEQTTAGTWPPNTRALPGPVSIEASGGNGETASTTSRSRPVAPRTGMPGSERRGGDGPYTCTFPGRLCALPCGRGETHDMQACGGRALGHRQPARRASRVALLCCAASTRPS